MSKYKHNDNKFEPNTLFHLSPEPIHHPISMPFRDYQGHDNCDPSQMDIDKQNYELRAFDGIGGCIKCGEDCPQSESSSSDTSGPSCNSGTQGSCRAGSYEEDGRRGKTCGRCPTAASYCSRVGNPSVCACKTCAGARWSQDSVCCNQPTDDGEGGQTAKPTCRTTEYYNEARGRCVSCPTGFKCGNFFGQCTKLSECDPSKTCPEGKYFDAGNCKQCDAGKTSKAGSTSKDKCVPECPENHFLSQEFGRCDKCAWPKT